MPVNENDRYVGIDTTNPSALRLGWQSKDGATSYSETPQEFTASYKSLQSAQKPVSDDYRQALADLDKHYIMT